MATIKIGGRSFAVSMNGTDTDKLPRFELRGARGAHYFTIRNQHNPEVMFLANARRFGMAPGRFAEVRLTDRGGELKQL